MRVHVSDGANRSHRIARIAFSVFSSRVTATTDADITAQQINGERNVFGLRAIGLLYTVDTVDRVTLAYVMWSVCQATDKLTQTNRKTEFIQRNFVVHSIKLLTNCAISFLVFFLIMDARSASVHVIFCRVRA